MSEYNTEHYSDRTAQAAMDNIERQDLERIKIAIDAAHGLFRIYGFRVEGRITLVDIKSGRTYR